MHFELIHFYTQLLIEVIQFKTIINSIFNNCAMVCYYLFYNFIFFIDLLAMCKEDSNKYRNQLIIAGDFNETDSTIIYNNIAIHTPAVAVNLYSNALLQKLSGNKAAYISTINDPIQLEIVVKYN